MVHDKKEVFKKKSFKKTGVGQFPEHFFKTQLKLQQTNSQNCLKFSLKSSEFVEYQTQVGSNNQFNFFSYQMELIGTLLKNKNF